MSSQTPAGNSIRYRVKPTHGGTGVAQYDFFGHGIDMAARLAPPEMRLCLEIFSPEHQWQQEGLQSYLDVPLGKVRMDYAKFETAAHGLFKKLGIVKPALQFERIQDGDVHKMRVKLPLVVLQENTTAMDAAYLIASKERERWNNSSPSR